MLDSLQTHVFYVGIAFKIESWEYWSSRSNSGAGMLPNIPISIVLISVTIFKFESGIVSVNQISIALNYVRLSIYREGLRR